MVGEPVGSRSGQSAAKTFALDGARRPHPAKTGLRRVERPVVRRGVLRHEQVARDRGEEPVDLAPRQKHEGAEAVRDGADPYCSCTTDNASSITPPVFWGDSLPGSSSAPCLKRYQIGIPPDLSVGLRPTGVCANVQFRTVKCGVALSRCVRLPPGPRILTFQQVTHSDYWHALCFSKGVKHPTTMTTR